MSATSPRILLAGNMLVDTVKRIPVWPERGMLVSIQGITRAVGGSVCNTAIDLKVLDPSLDVCALGNVGADDAGAFVVETLARHGVDASRVARVPDVPTSFTDVMTVATTGERTFFNMHGADSTLTAERLAGEAIASRCRHLHLGYLMLLDSLDAPDAEFGTCAARALAKVREAGIQTSVDLVSEASDRFAPSVRAALPHCDYLIVNEVEGGFATGLDPRDGAGDTSPARLRAICEALLRLGVRRRAVLHCPEMSVSLEIDGTFASLPSLSLPPGWIRGAVGAGDAFCAGMLYSILRSLPPAEGLDIATHCAACNLSAPDSIGGARPLAETMAVLP